MIHRCKKIDKGIKIISVHVENCKSKNKQATCGVIDVELEVRHIEQAGVVVHVQHVRVESGEVEHILRARGQRQLQRHHLAEGPIISGRRERTSCPLADQTAGNHRSLNLDKRKNITEFIS